MQLYGNFFLVMLCPPIYATGLRVLGAYPLRTILFQILLADGVEKKKVQFEKRNPDPDYFRSRIQTEFPRLAGRAFRLFRMERNRTELIALPDDVNNAVALCDHDQLNRSHLYIKPEVKTQPIPSPHQT